MSRPLLRILYALINLLGIVGVGTLLAGRVKTGIAQILLSIATIALTLVPLAMLFHLALGNTSLNDVMQQTSHGNLTWQFNLTRRLQDGGPEFQLRMLSLLMASLAGCLLFFLNWVWSGTTTQPLDPPPPPLPHAD